MHGSNACLNDERIVSGMLCRLFVFPISHFWQLTQFDIHQK